MLSHLNPDTTSLNDDQLYRKYIAALDEKLTAISSHPGISFSQLASKMYGAFPSLILERLRTLGLEEKILINQTIVENSRSHNIVPELHALDFEWYFTPACAKHLANMLNEYEGPTLCMGAPTVAVSIARLKHSVYLADKNSLLEKRLPEDFPHLQFILWDLYEALPLRRRFPLVFFDAPWYFESIKTWLWQAARTVQPGGLIAFSLFPTLLRPSAEAERHQLLSMAESIGQVDIKEGFLEYETPLFEEEALAGVGITSIGNWRHGDLILVKNVYSSNGETPNQLPLLGDDWESFVIGSQVIKLRNPVHGNKEVILEPLQDYPDFIYSSVSMRDSSRGLIDIWTSRNRVARVGQRGIVLNVLRRLAEGLSIHETANLPMLSLISSEEREKFLSNLRLILAFTPEESHDLTHSGA